MDISAQIPPPDGLQTQLSVPEARQLAELARNGAIEALILASRAVAPERAGTAGSYRLQMQVGRDVVEVSAKHDFPEGTKLLVRALSPSRIRVEQVLRVPQPRLPAVLVEALRASLPRQLPMREALNQIQTLAREEAGLSSELRTAITRLMDTLPRADSTQHPEGLRRAIRQSGVFFEAALRQTVAGATPGSRGHVTSASSGPGTGATSATSRGTETAASSLQPSGQRGIGGSLQPTPHAGGMIAPAALARATDGSTVSNAGTIEAPKPASPERAGVQGNPATPSGAAERGRASSGIPAAEIVAQTAHPLFTRASSPLSTDTPARRTAAPVDGLLSLLRLIQRPGERSAVLRETGSATKSAAARAPGIGSRTDPASLYDARGRMGAPAPGVGNADSAAVPPGRQGATGVPPAPARQGDQRRPPQSARAGGDRAKATARAQAVDRTPDAAHRRARSEPAAPSRSTMEAAPASDSPDGVRDTKARLMALLELLRPGTQWSRTQPSTQPSSSQGSGAQPQGPAAALYTPRGTLEGAPAGRVVGGPPRGIPAADARAGSAQASRQQALAEASRVQQMQDTLAHYVESALARTRVHQLNSLPESRSTPDNGALAAWVVELPLARGDGFDSLEMRIEDHGHGVDDEGRPARIWQVMLRLEVEETGPMHAFLQLAGTRLAATLWAERAATLRSARAALQDLELCLQAEGVEVTRLECIPGRPEAGESRLFDRLLDIRT